MNIELAQAGPDDPEPQSEPELARLCGTGTEVRDDELIEVVRTMIEPGTAMGGNAIEGMRVSAVCDLEAGHPGSHASLLAFSNPPSPWLQWAPPGREVIWPEDCPYLAGTDYHCMLYESHPGAHHCDDSGPSPSWSYRNDRQGSPS